MSTTRRSSARALAALVGVAALIGANAGIAHGKPGGEPAVPLNTGQEVGVVDAGSSGFFSYTITDDEICYTLTARNLTEPALAAHIHIAPRNVAGPIVIPLEVGAGTTWTVEACTTASVELLAAIEANPRGYYVNVHTPDFPGGEIRGQLK